MAYSDPASKVAGDTFDLAAYDVFRDNWLASAVRAMDAKGDLVGGTGANALTRLAVGNDDSTLVADSGESTGLAWQIQPACRVYNSANINPSTSSWVTLTFDSERYDTDAMHDTGSNTDRITVPTNGDGIYSFGCNAKFVTNGLTGQGGEYGVRIALNGSTVLAEDFREQAMNGDDLVISVSGTYALSATDYLVAEVYTTKNVDVGSAGNYSPEFWATWQRRQ